MKKILISIVCSCFLFGSAILPVTTVMATENKNTLQVSEPNNFVLDPGTSIQLDEAGNVIVTKIESKLRVNISRWGGWTYTNIAVSTGVAANAINAAFYAGIGASVSMFGIPGWVIAGLLTGASWTNLGASPGNAVAKHWDKNKNGWVGFYTRLGYDGAGRVVASQYKTE